MVDGVAFYSAKMFQTSMLIFPVTLAASVLLVLWIKEPKHEKKNDLATTHLDSLAIGE
jgi:hypothetical protein